MREVRGGRKTGSRGREGGWKAGSKWREEGEK